MSDRDSRAAQNFRRKSYHHGNLAETLMAITLEIVREQGVAHVSLREVAKRAGVSSSAPFRHFPTKEALLAALIDESEALLQSSVIQAVKALETQDPVARLTALARAYLEWVIGHPERFMLIQSSALEPIVGLGRLEKYDSHIKNLLIETLEEARKQKRLRDDVDIELAVISARALGVGLAQMAIRGGKNTLALEIQQERLVDALVQYNRLLCKAE